MNIYKVTDVDTGKTFTATTNELMEQLYINRDALFWHVKNKSQYCGYMFEKIGTDGNSKKPKKEIPLGTKINKGLDEDLKQATILGMSYGEYKHYLQNKLTS